MACDYEVPRSAMLLHRVKSASFSVEKRGAQVVLLFSTWSR